MRETHKIELIYDDVLVDEVAKRCTEVESGARNVDNILTNTLLPDISRKLLEHIAEGRKPQGIRAGIGEDGGFTYSLFLSIGMAAYSQEGRPFRVYTPLGNEYCCSRTSKGKRASPAPSSSGSIC